MARNAFIVAYDICDNARRIEVANACLSYGIRIQYSVFRCHLTATERVAFEVQLRDAINNAIDQVILADLGPVDGRAARCVSTIGLPHQTPTDGPTIM